MSKKEFYISAQNLLKESTRFEQMSDFKKTIYFVACTVNSNFFSFFTGIILAIPVNLLTNFFSQKVSSVSVMLGLASSIFLSLMVTFQLVTLTIFSIELQSDFQQNSPLESRLNRTFDYFISNEEKITKILLRVSIFGILTIFCLVYSFLELNEMV